MPFVEIVGSDVAREHGIVGVGGSLRPEALLAAYRRGIFPWPAEGMPLLWFSPPERAVLRFADVHRGRSLRRALRRAPWRYTIDAAFADVIAACARAPRRDADGTWITAEVESGYTELHRRGHAHSVEVWEGHELVGGIYGVDADGAFSAESMFHRRPNASKAALLHLVEHLSARGLDWMDIQVMSPHMQKMGACEIPRRTFLRWLAATRARGLTLFPR